LAETFAIALGLPAQTVWSASEFTAVKEQSSTVRNVIHITIITRLDEVTVTGVEVNRGNCQLTKPFKPSPMKFGENLRVTVVNCDPLEVQLETDKWVFTLSW
jgi:hypothetical protein